MTVPRLAILAGLAILASTLAANLAPADYVFTNFDGPGSANGGTTVNGINNNGDIVGFGGTAPQLVNFVRTAGGAFTTLNVNGDPLANANAINNAGEVVGTSNGAGFTLTNAFRTFTALPSVTATTTSEVALGINDRGTIVGQYADSATGTTPGFVYANGSFTALTPVAGATVTNAQGINNNGLVVGFDSTDGVHSHGFTYNTVSGVYATLPDPSVANLVFTQFLGINDGNQTVGYYQTTDGSQHGFLFDLRTQRYTYLDHPFAATTGVSITQIVGITNSGTIAGFYVDAVSGVQRGFSANAAVPEPGSFLLLGIGLASGLAIVRRRRAVAGA